MLNQLEEFFGFMDQLPATNAMQDVPQFEPLSKELETHSKSVLYKEQPVPRGEFKVIDDSKVFGETFNSDLTTAAEKLIEAGAKIVIITTDDTGQSAVGQEISTPQYLSNKLAELGYETADSGLDPFVIACLLNYEAGEVQCAIGAHWFSALSESEITEAQELIIQQAGNGSRENNQSAIRLALEYFYQEIKETNQTQGTQEQIAPQVSQSNETDSDVTAAGSAETEETTAQIGVPEDYETTNQSEKKIPFAGGIALLVGIVALAAYGVPEFKRRKESLELIRSLSKSAAKSREIYSSLLSSQIPYNAFQRLMEIFEKNHPDRAGEMGERYDAFLKSVNTISELSEVVDTTNINILKGSKTLGLLTTVYIDLIRDLDQILKEIESITNEFNDVHEKIERAQSVLSIAKQAFASMEEWVDDLQATYGTVISSKEVVLAAIKEQLNTAITCFEPDRQTELLGSELAGKAMELIDQKRTELSSYIKIVDSFRELEAHIALAFADWSDVVDSPTDFLASAQRLIQEAKENFDYAKPSEEIQASTYRIQSEINQIQEFVQKFTNALRLTDADSKQVTTYIDRGYFQDHIQQLQHQIDMDIQNVISIGKAGHWTVATDSIALVVSHSSERVVELERLEALQQKNEFALRELSKQVALVQRNHSAEVKQSWHKLQSNYVLENYVGYENNFSQADQLLREIFDDPANENDLASEAARFNSMESQVFSKAETTISVLQRKLIQANTLMDELISQSRKVEAAERNYEEAIQSAFRHISEARRTVQHSEDDRLVTEQVESDIEDANSVLEDAKSKGQQKVFIAALDLANKAMKDAIAAQKDAEQQITEIKSLYAELERSQASAHNKVRAVLSQVENEADAVVTAQTMEEARRIQREISALDSDKNRLATYEDRALAQQLQKLISDYSSFETNRARAVLDSLEIDKRNHQALLDTAGRAISEAVSAISAARQKVNDRKSGLAGQSLLNAAISENPSLPTWGTTESEISRVIARAESAKRKADEARSAAERAIRQREEEEEAERRRLEAEAERKRRQEQAEEAERRRQEKARQDAIDRARQQQQQRDRAEQLRRSSQRSGSVSKGLRK